MDAPRFWQSLGATFVPVGELNHCPRSFQISNAGP
jgi:hypothetical protein